MNIVIVDDNPDTAGMLRMLFGLQGHSALVAFSGKTGIELACVAEPDLVIVDVDLPDMDGMEVVRSLHSICEQGQCRIVVYTGRSDHDTRHRAQQAGAEHVVIKRDDIGGLLAIANWCAVPIFRQDGR